MRHDILYLFISKAIIGLLHPGFAISSQILLILKLPHRYCTIDGQVLGQEISGGAEQPARG